jgi:microcystin-dependent protein
MESFVGTIQAFGFDYAPQDWSTCAGQILSISQNNVLFALLGTYYGGNGQTTFGLPDLRGRAPIGYGTGPGLPSYNIGEADGSTTTVLTNAQLPMHSHTVLANPANPQAPGNLQMSVQVAGAASSPVNAPTASNNFLGASGGGQGQAAIWSNALGSPVTMGGTSISTNAMVGPAGNSQALDIMNPFLAINFCIAVNGLFPPRQ